MHKATSLPLLLTLLAAAITLGLSAIGFSTIALVWALASAIILLSVSESGGSQSKLMVTSVLGVSALLVFGVSQGLGPASGGAMIAGFDTLAHALHLEIFLFLFGLYVVVGTFTYSGIIGDMAWKVVKITRGHLAWTLAILMVLTCMLSGIFDGATVASVMGVIALTILVSSGMPTKDMVKILILLVVATNIGGVWFVLGEPTNILAAEKLGLSPLFFLQYALPFAVPAAVLCAWMAARIARNLPRIAQNRPDTEILLEGISLRRTHGGSGSLSQTLRQLGTVELRQLAELERLEEEGVPDFEAALQAGIPRGRLDEALAVNLNSAELATTLIDYWQYRAENNPMAEILAGDLLHYVRSEYEARARSRWLVLLSGGVLIGLLVAHAFVSAIPTWASTISAGLVALVAVRGNARLAVLDNAWKDLKEAFFLLPLFGMIYLVKELGLFELAAAGLLSVLHPVATASVILVGSTAFSAFSDNIAVMDILTNIIAGHAEWPFFALAAIVGTAVGGFASPIASVQALILAVLIRRVAATGFWHWVRIASVPLIILTVVSALLLGLMYLMGWPVVDTVR